MAEADHYIMVTRPVGQAADLSLRIEQAGGQVFACPLIEISPTHIDKALCQQLAPLDHCDLAIFISRNAVHYAFSALQACQSTLPATLKLAAVGEKTAALLAERTQRAVDHLPKQQNSEGLLAMPALQSIQGQRIVIFRGDSGRELLAETLRERGAEVRYVEVYQRKLPRGSQARLNQHLQNQQLDVILITSGEALNNLLKITDNDNRADLFDTPLIVINQRLEELARQLGFRQQVILAHHASDDAMMAALQQHGFLNIDDKRS